MDKNRAKTYAAIAIVIVASLATVVLTQNSYSSSDVKSNGILIDFGDRNVTWTEVDFDVYSDPAFALIYSCDVNGYALETESDYSVISINGISNDATHKWGLWCIGLGETAWTLYDGDILKMRLSDYKVICWAYCTSAEKPSVALDYTGVSVYGYGKCERIVTLAPSVTETVCAVGAENAIVGTDQYSNYPDHIVSEKAKGNIVNIGGYTNPSYEMIVNCNPDIVICYGGQGSHVEMAEKLRKAGIDVIVLYGSEDIGTLYDNIFITGMGLSYDIKTRAVISDITKAMDSVESLFGDYVSDVSLMVTLSTLKSPYVSGSNTYINDISGVVCGSNIYSDQSGWVQITAESIPKLNPSVIILITSDYSATEEDYNSMLSSLSEEWKNTDAYKNGNIYMLADGASDLASRAGPRFSQITELLGRILHSEVFPDGITVPKWVGTDYYDYLTYTKELGFN